MSLLTFVITLALSSTVIGLLLILTGSALPRARHWPLFWGAGLIASVSAAFLAVALSQLTVFAPQFHIPPLPISEAFDPSTWPAFAEARQQQTSTFDWPQFLSKGVAYIYVIGVCMNLLRLGAGRYRATKIAMGSAKTTLADGTVIGITREDLPCMTLTPFGRPRQSMIIISEPFYKALSEAELGTVIAHEKGHIIRRDDEFGIVLRLFAALTWFNPIIHNLFDRWTLSAELQCDQIATQDQSYPMRRAYAQTLLKALHITADRVRQYPAASLSTQHLRNEKMRIRRIMNGPAPIFKHIGHKLGLITATAGIALISAAAMSATAQADPAPMPDAPPALNSEPRQKLNSFKIAGELTSSYGEARDPFNAGKVRNHHGVDFKAPKGTPIYAPLAGVIIEATDLFNNNPKYGKVVILQTSDGLQTMMAHLEGYPVQSGQQVLKGQKIAEIGSTGKSTGPHVHIETRLNNRRVDPMSVWHFGK